MPAPIVFFDIAGPDAASLQDFYTSVFQWEISHDGKFSHTLEWPLEGVIREDPQEKRIYLGVPDINSALAAVVEHGGSIDVPRFEVGGVVVLGLFRDPAGNPMGLVEMAENGPRIP